MWVSCILSTWDVTSSLHRGSCIADTVSLINLLWLFCEFWWFLLYSTINVLLKVNCVLYECIVQSGWVLSEIKPVNGPIISMIMCFVLFFVYLCFYLCFSYFFFFLLDISNRKKNLKMYYVISNLLTNMHAHLMLKCIIMSCPFIIYYMHVCNEESVFSSLLVFAVTPC